MKFQDQGSRFSWSSGTIVWWFAANSSVLTFSFPTWCKQGSPREFGSHSLNILMYIKAHVPLLALPLLHSLNTAKTYFAVSKRRIFRRRFIYRSTIFTSEYLFFTSIEKCQQAIWKDRKRGVVKYLHSYLFYSNWTFEMHTTISLQFNKEDAEWSLYFF